MWLAQGGQAPDTMLVAAGELEDKEWALILDKLNHDKTLVTAYVKKSQDAKTFSFHVARDHARKRHMLARAATDFFFQNHCYVFELVDAMSANIEIMNCINTAAEKMSVQSNQIVCVPWVNLTAPIVYSNVQTNVVCVTSWASV